MTRNARTMFAGSLCALTASCAGIQYRSLPREPYFELPFVQPLELLDDEIKATKKAIEEREREVRDAAAGSEEAKAAQEVLDALLEGLTSKEKERESVAKQNDFARRVHDDIKKHNLEAAARNEELDRESGLGIRFYQPSPYLLVYADGKGGLVWEIHHLPDPSKKMSAKPYNYLSTLEAKLTFDDHYLLTSTHEVADTTAIPSAVLSKIGELAPLIAAALNAPRENSKESVPAPRLYKIVEQHGRIQFVGGAVEPVEVLWTPPPDSDRTAAKQEGSS